MRKVGYLFFLVILVATACTSSNKLLEKGRYNQAIEKSASALRKDPSDSDELNVLKEAFSQANSFDQEQIDFLVKENRDENNYNIYNLYTRLQNRQDVIRSLPSQVRSQFSLVNYNDKIIEYKEGAAETYYQQGLDYLNRGDRMSARMAYQQFVNANNIYNNYKDVDQMLNKAQILGTNFVLLKIENNSEKVLPKDFDTELRKIGLGDLDSQWVQYEAYDDTSLYYDYNVVINIQDIQVSPETVSQKTYTESKEIQDGMKYVLDENGNVRKDSLGNDMKEPNMVTISADVTESLQHKQAVVGGSIDYIDLQTNQLIKTQKISVNYLFEHYSAVFSGNEDALSDETDQKVKSRPIPFPPNEQMLMDAAQKLKEKAKDIIYANRGLLAS